MMQRNKKVLIERFGKYLNVERQWDKAKALGKEEREWILDAQVTTFESLLQNPPWDRGTPNPKHQTTVAP